MRCEFHRPTWHYKGSTYYWQPNRVSINEGGAPFNIAILQVTRRKGDPEGKYWLVYILMVFMSIDWTVKQGNESRDKRYKMAISLLKKWAKHIVCREHRKMLKRRDKASKLVPVNPE